MWKGLPLSWEAVEEPLVVGMERLLFAWDDEEAGRTGAAMVVRIFERGSRERRRDG